jgi:hypothetical protein
MRHTQRLLALALCCGAGAGAAATSRAATLQGRLTYAGEPLLATFSASDFASASVRVREAASGAWSEGAVDPATSSYQVEGLPAGIYEAFVLLSPLSAQLAGEASPRSGELAGWVAGIELDGTDQAEVDVAMTYAVRLTLPFDSAALWPGTPWQCPGGPAVPSPVSVAWNSVPRAVRYEVHVERRSCTQGLLRSETLTPLGTSVQIPLGAAEGEDELLVRDITAYDGGGVVLSQIPWIAYESGLSSAIYLYSEESEGRPAHSTVGQFVPQVAKVKGVGTSFWTSTLTLTNPTRDDVTATLYFTARDADGLSASKEASVTVPAGACRVWEDVLQSLFSASGAGALEVHDSTLIVASRTFTSNPAGGTYGQGYMPIRKDHTASHSSFTTLQGGGVVKGDFRTNLTLNEIWGESARVKVELFDADLLKLGERVVDLHRYGNVQINDVVTELGGVATLTDGQVKVTVMEGDGHVAATLSVVDNGTDDPTTIPLALVAD